MLGVGLVYLCVIRPYGIHRHLIAPLNSYVQLLYSNRVLNIYGLARVLLGIHVDILRAKRGRIWYDERS